MPLYHHSKNFCAKYKTDEEKKKQGFMSGNCVNASIRRFAELSQKFGNHFDLVMIVAYRNKCSLLRLMNKTQIREFMDKGQYLIHFKVFNRKLKQYIDTSNGDMMIVDEAQEHIHMTEGKNQYYKIYRFPLLYFVKYENGEIGKFCNDRLTNQDICYSQGQDRQLMDKGVKIVINSKNVN